MKLETNEGNTAASLHRKMVKSEKILIGDLHFQHKKKVTAERKQGKRWRFIWLRLLRWPT